MVADDLEQRLGIPLINIVDVTATAIKLSGLAKVGLLGTRYTMEMDFFTKRLCEAHIAPIIPNHEDRAFIHATIFDELSRGETKQESKGRYLDIFAKLEMNGRTTISDSVDF